MSEQICDVFINISSDKKQCQLLKGHSGFHRMGQLEWNWPGQPDQATDKPPVASAEGEPPPLPEPYRQNPPLYSMIGEQQREKWRKQWAKMDAEDCERQHYKHYEWECRNTFEELEARERQLLAAREEIAAFKRVAEAWEETAAQHCRNEMFYHGIVTEIGEPFGVAAKTSDDGSIQEDVLALRVPELVTQLRQSHSNLLAFVKRNHTGSGWVGCPTCELISSAEALEGK